MALKLIGRWLTFVAFTIMAFAAHAAVSANDSAEVELGRQIYLKGQLPSGKPLKGQRLNSVEIEGEAAACETCHRASGMGSLEGNIVVPPITGRFLFATDENRPIALLDTRAPKNVTRAHKPYTEGSIAKAIREGINVSGAQMSSLMPRYALSKAEIKAVTAYLRQLSAELSPGASTDTLHFATIITPGVDPKQREVMLSMMRTAFTQRNASQQASSGRMRMPLDLIPHTLRNWELAVWELQGTPETWAAQLAENYRREPVFAVISGLSNTSWAPVHDFCQQAKLPCIFPSIALPPKETAFYPLYFSRGVALEADVLAKHLRDQGEKAPRRLIQIYRDDEVGRGAAQALTQALHDSGIQVEDRILHGQDPAGLSEPLKGLTNNDTLVLWLRPVDLSALNKVVPKPPSTAAYVSGFLAEDNYEVFSETWKSQVRFVYPYELGDKRLAGVTTLQKWLKTWNLPLVNEALQTEVFFNLLFLTDLSSQMLDNLYRDYLIERAEDMLSSGTNSSIYPRLSLARGQRFASKGAYIARFAKDGKLVAETDWIVP